MASSDLQEKFKWKEEGDGVCVCVKERERDRSYRPFGASYAMPVPKKKFKKIANEDI